MHTPYYPLVPERSFTDAEVDEALEALSDPERFKSAEALVARNAPQLQRILNSALKEGGWFEQAKDSRLGQALALEDPDERTRQVTTLMVEETRVGMLVGVAVGWALAHELEGKRDA
jgi:hypothetical protein